MYYSRSRNLFLFLGFLLLTAWLPCGCAKEEPVTVHAVNGPAADFSLPDSAGHFMKLSDVQPGWYLVLFFYRGYWCPACMNQLLDFKKDIDQFTAVHATLAAVSVDTVEDSAAFNAQWRFPFPLLSDTEFKLIDAYGFREPKGHKQADISKVGIVIIDPQKKVRYQHGGEITDRLTDQEVVYDIQQLQAGKQIPQ